MSSLMDAIRESYPEPGWDHLVFSDNATIQDGDTLLNLKQMNYTGMMAENKSLGIRRIVTLDENLRVIRSSDGAL